MYMHIYHIIYIYHHDHIIKDKRYAKTLIRNFNLCLRNISSTVYTVYFFC